MKNHSRPAFPRQLSFIFMLLVIVLAAGCNVPTAKTATPASASTASGQASVATVLPQPTDSPTAVPVSGPMAVLVAAPGAQPELEAALKHLAGKANLAMETRADLQPADLNAGWKVVVLAQAPANLADLLSAAPQTQFVVIGQDVLAQQAPNLTGIVVRREDEAFLAGYVAQLISTRTSPVGLFSSDVADTAALQEGFTNGGRYHCGLCVLLDTFERVGPLLVAQPAASDANAWQAAIAGVAKKGLDVVYVSPEVSSPALLSALAAQNARLIGSSAPPPGVESQWVATLHANTAETLRLLWPDLLAGKGGKSVAARITISDIAAQWLSPGRQRLVAQALLDMENGLLSSKSVQ